MYVIWCSTWIDAHMKKIVSSTWRFTNAIVVTITGSASDAARKRPVAAAVVGLHERVRERGVQVRAADEPGDDEVHRGLRDAEPVVEQQRDRDERRAEDEERQVPGRRAQPHAGRRHRRAGGAQAGAGRGTTATFIRTSIRRRGSASRSCLPSPPFRGSSLDWSRGSTPSRPTSAGGWWPYRNVPRRTERQSPCADTQA